MQCLCWPLFLLAVPFQVETGRSAEPPIKCKLNLVRLEPLPRDKPCPENERLLRSTVPQSFYMKVENNVVDKGSKEAETKIPEQLSERSRRNIRLNILCGLWQRLVASNLVSFSTNNPRNRRAMTGFTLI